MPRPDRDQEQAPITHEHYMSELPALEEAGYYPEWYFNPYYPANLEAAQRQVDIWYATECPQTCRP
jgi:hypothetical protein